MAVRERAVVDRPAIASQSVYGRDNWRAHTRATEYQPAGCAKRVIDGDARVRVGHGCHVRDSTLRAAGIVLPARLGFEGATAAACAVPHCLRPATRIIGRDQAGAAPRRHEPGSGRILRPEATVAR